MWNESEWFNGMYSAQSVQQGPPFETVWTLPAGFPLLDGHFPGLPIFPAVAIVDATLHFLKGVTKDSNAYIHNVASAKFSGPITPGVPVKLVLNPVGEKEWEAEWKEAASDKTLAALRVQLLTANG
jgi:3-hydroxymyristoyl/3-hydroxydecanoyl-(acyl carrier protein) dehydratase